MDINNIIKVKFLKSDETISGSNIKETDIELDNLLKLISDVEEKEDQENPYTRKLLPELIIQEIPLSLTRMSFGQKMKYSSIIFLKVQFLLIMKF